MIDMASICQCVLLLFPIFDFSWPQSALQQHVYILAFQLHSIDSSLHCFRSAPMQLLFMHIEIYSTTVWFQFMGKNKRSECELKLQISLKSHRNPGLRLAQCVVRWWTSLFASNWISGICRRLLGSVSFGRWACMWWCLYQKHVAHKYCLLNSNGNSSWFFICLTNCCTVFWLCTSHLMRFIHELCKMSASYYHW